jgi:PP-loop superfamily ATP-utilizing enzyme
MSDPAAWRNAAEAAGFPRVRVAPDGLKGEIARLSAPPGEMERLLREGRPLAEALRALGFAYVAVELEDESDAR